MRHGITTPTQHAKHRRWPPRHHDANATRRTSALAATPAPVGHTFPGARCANNGHPIRSTAHPLGHCPGWCRSQSTATVDPVTHQNTDRSNITVDPGVGHRPRHPAGSRPWATSPHAAYRAKAETRDRHTAKAPHPFATTISTRSIHAASGEILHLEHDWRHSSATAGQALPFSSDLRRSARGLGLHGRAWPPVLAPT